MACEQFYIRNQSCPFVKDCGRHRSLQDPLNTHGQKNRENSFVAPDDEAICEEEWTPPPRNLGPKKSRKPWGQPDGCSGENSPTHLMTPRPISEKYNDVQIYQQDTLARAVKNGVYTPLCFENFDKPPASSTQSPLIIILDGTPPPGAKPGPSKNPRVASPEDWEPMVKPFGNVNTPQEDAYPGSSKKTTDGIR
ncbi:hypothetical protein O181_006110 [Austropuccinia psidii MF-1]|uniref:Uncharacterized protein n=1 Tax=Austropuccinia psidii MF-1 TaxID=1389203 RepID=A0A9Q3BKB3_9BASI|nr:hypothetical protein [Austropuccinia psidii MF-1]